jgi:hypothetical protein
MARGSAMPRASFTLAALAALAPAAAGQMSDRCAPGWSMLNRVREQLTAETSVDALKLLQVSIQRHLGACPDIPDLWYYRAVVGDRLRDTKDATFARKEAESRGSGAFFARVNPFASGGEVAAATLSSRIGEKYAVVVGINEFEHAQPLHFAVNDAIGVADTLSDPKVGRFPKDHVVRLTDGAATLNGVRTAIGTIRERAKSDDLVVVYIASHGSPRGMDPNGVSYVAMHDTKIDTAANLYATSLQMIDLVEMMRRDVLAKRVVIILDTCFSGNATSSRVSLVHSPSPDLGPPSEFSVAADKFEDKNAKGIARVVISASRADEESQEDAKLQHGYFTYFLLEALKKNSGTSPLGEVFESARERTSQTVHDRFNLTQNPTIRGTAEGLSIVMGAPSGGQ